MVSMEEFKGVISDIGGPTANMYNMRGKNIDLCYNCKRDSCIFPAIVRILIGILLHLLNYTKACKTWRESERFLLAAV